MTAVFLQNTRIGAPWLGIVIPAAVLLISIFLTWFLYKRFSEPENNQPHQNGSDQD